MAIIEVLKWDAAPRVFAYKYPNVELNTKSQLIVAESQEAILVSEGRFFGPFGPGRHVLNTKNYPFLTRIATALVSGGDSPFTAEVWFIQQAIPLDIKWGTMDPIQVEDPKYHIMLPVRSFGQYGVKIIHSEKFLSKMVGRVPVFVEKTLSEYFRGIIVTRVKDCIGSYLIEQNISVLQIANKLNVISDFLQKKISIDLEEYGMSVVTFMVNSISTDDRDPAVVRLKDALAKKAEMDIIGYTYQQERSFDTMETAAGNQSPGGAMMNAGIGLGMGMGMGGPMGRMAGRMAESMVPGLHVGLPGTHQEKHLDTDQVACEKCGTKNSKGINFCSCCGTALHECPTCGAPIAQAMKLCGECGTRLQKICPKCGQEVDAKFAFCPHCGNKLNQGAQSK